MDFDESNPLIKNLTCTNCGNYLSYFPIHSTNNWNICGRCPLPDPTVVRNLMYEALAQNIEFPCRYFSRGCTEQLLPSNVPKHESQCFSRSIKCPASEFNLCNDKISLCDLTEHVKSVHNELILRDGEFKINLSRSGHAHNIILQDAHFIIFKRVFDCVSIKLSCEIYPFDNLLSNESFELILRNDFRSFSMKGLISQDLSKNDCDNISLDLLKSPRYGPTVRGKLIIGKQDQVTTNTKFQQEFLELLKCSYCLRYLKPPLCMFLGDGNTMCEQCSKSNYSFKDNRFNKLAEELNYPCQFQVIGCNYSGRLLLLKQHEKECLYKMVDCRICEYEDIPCEGPRKNLMQHIMKKHQNYITETNEFTVEIIRPFKVFLKIFDLHQNFQSFFLLKFYQDQNFYNWSVFQVGDVRSQFKYEIELVNKAKGCATIILTHLCLRFEEDKCHDSCYLNFEQIENMLTGGALTFKVRILRCSNELS